MAKSATESRSGGLRKKPLQARSRARVAGILKAAGSLLGEVGYDGLSTNLIAERAQVPVGSIYQFFEGKDDIVAALVEQFQDRILRLVSAQLDVDTAVHDRRAFIARLIDGIAGIQAEASAFVCVFSGSQTHARFDGLARDLRRTLTRHLDRVFAEAFPRLPKDDRGRMLAAWSDITGAMIANLDRSKPGERGKLLEELKTILGAYLDAKLAAAG
ncbi:MAG: TetR/AcrR family transcriptional regulator [Xanthobacteraceae bacterium]|jgi:AcrR family transcriptional regulator